MKSYGQIAPDVFVEKMKGEMGVYLKDGMQAVHDAPDGEWVAGSEERVRDLSAKMRRKVFERAVQMKADAAVRAANGSPVGEPRSPHQLNTAKIPGIPPAMEVIEFC